MTATICSMAHIGLWCLLRGTETLPSSLLSLLSQLLRDVLSAQRNRKNPQTVLDGVNITVRPSAALIMCSRLEGEGNTDLQPLPAVLRQLLRPVVTHTFSPTLVVAAWLSARGFAASMHLASVLVCFTELAKKALTPSAHYDWGLRLLKRILAVCQAAEGIDGESLGLPESLKILGHAAVRSIKPRLLPQDDDTFRALAELAFFSNSVEHEDSKLPVTDDHLHQVPLKPIPVLMRAGSKRIGKSPLQKPSPRTPVVEKLASIKRTNSSYRMHFGVWVTDMGKHFGGEEGTKQEQSLDITCKSLGLQAVPAYEMRAVQLLQSLEAFNTAMVIGPPGCGKSMLIKVPHYLLKFVCLSSPASCAWLRHFDKLICVCLCTCLRE